MVEEARLEETDGSVAPATEGWFVVNVRDGRWVTTGARSENKETVYPHSEPAIRHGAGVETETSSAREAHAPFPKWKDGRPKTWDGLPWA